MSVGSSLTNTGVLKTSSSVSQFDEVTISPISGGLSQRTTSTAYQVAGNLDEVTLASGSIGFNGTQYLTLPSNQTQFTMGTGDFTIEMWVYVTSLAANRTLYDTVNQGDATGTGRFSMQITTGGVVQVFTLAGTIFTQGGTISVNTWNHIAYTKSSNSGRLFVNGIQVNTTYTDNNNYVVGTVSRPIIGINGYDNSTNPMIGYMSNFRLVKGTAVYTSNFIPSQEVLTTISGTSLLLNVLDSSNFIKDNSTNSFTVTNNGTAVWNINSPFGINNTGSINLAGSTQWLSIPASTGLNLGDPGYPTTVNGPNFTIELWFYCTSFSTGVTMLNKDGVAATSYSQYGYDISSSGVLTFYVGHGDNASTGTGTQQSFTVGTVVLNRWYHVAACQSSTNQIKVFLNGTLISTTTRTQLMVDGGKPLLVGWQQNQPTASRFPGYITNLRILKNTAAYSTSFTPVGPLLPVANTSLLLNVYNSSTFLTDSSTTNATVTNNGTATYSSLVPFGTTKQRQVSPSVFGGPVLEVYSTFDEVTLA